ncbi:MAG: TrkA family potassium uptake protein [Chloroflexi bacterium]|nr:MAG: TrkA family potassium uptake protein [Chloroflexota bacterium]
MRIIVVGCGRAGSALAYQLYVKGHRVTVIDQDASTFENLPADFQGHLVQGDVLTRNVLERAEIESADSLVAVTNSDSLNVLLAHIARTEYQIPRVVAGNYDPRQRPLQEAFGIPVVSSATWAGEHI